MSYSDTSEQAAVIGWSGHRLVVRAFAGTGKTSTLVRYALANPDSRMFYLAYNHAVRDEAEQKFPFNVECKNVASAGLAQLRAAFPEAAYGESADT